MPKGRRSNDRHRNGRQLAARYDKDYDKNGGSVALGYAKLQALYDRALEVQKRRRDRAKRLRQGIRQEIRQGIKIK